MSTCAWAIHCARTSRTSSTGCSMTASQAPTTVSYTTMSNLWYTCTLQVHVHWTSDVHRLYGVHSAYATHGIFSTEAVHRMYTTDAVHRILHCTDAIHHILHCTDAVIDILNKDCWRLCSAILTWVLENVKISVRPLNSVGNERIFTLLLKF